VNKFFQNVRTHYNNMISLSKRVMAMYMPLLARMAENSPSIIFAKLNFELFCDVNLFIFLSCFLPM
jgi:hypothetical protein